jgi:hypothetical protein
VLAESNFLKGDILEILAGWDETATEDPLKSKVMLLCRKKSYGPWTKQPVLI